MDEPMRCYRHPDRETRVSCSECGRPICTDCMVFAPVGIRCPEHAGSARPRRPGTRQVTRPVQRVARGETLAPVTKALVALNVLVYLAELAEGAGVNATSGWIYTHGVLVASGQLANGQVVGVAHGDWWRLITAAFLHYGPLHLGMNMLALWWFGGPVESYLGSLRFLLLYLVSGLAGSAGALLATPHAATVGASGAIFGILGAMLVLQYQRTGAIRGPVLTLIAINLAFSFAVAGISWGGHVGGLVGGALGTLAISRFGRGHAAYGRLGFVGVLTLAAIAAASVALAYWRAKHG